MTCPPPEDQHTPSDEDHVSSTAPTQSLAGPAGSNGEKNAEREQRAAAQVGVRPGMHIGRYQVESVIGEGGMGIVFRATQRRPRRDVALKIIRPSVASESMMRRFELEAEVLGRLQHPGVAQIHDAGIVETEVGSVAFFAMELIDGAPLTQYVQQQQLWVPDRLRLLARVCDAVQHAHQKGVIHRDLKPANVLVTRDGQPKILDFGVARATDADIHAATMRTTHGELVGTIPYMSPEQASGDPSKLDTRSDVYALGVMGFELLTGRLPYDIERTAVHEAVRIIIEQPPTRLSVASRVYRGDVETIMAKALEKSPDRRYSSAGEMAADIRRFLNNEPIEARPASVVYQMTRFVRRHRLIVGSLAVIIVVLFAAVIIISTFAMRESAARRQAQTAQQQTEDALALAESRRIKAEREARKATAITEFLTDDMLKSADPASAPDGEVSVRSVLDDAADTVGQRFADEPEVEAAIRFTLGSVYYSLGRGAETEREIRTSAELYEQELGLEAPRTLRAWSMYADVLRLMGKLDESKQLFERIEPAYVSVFGPDHSETLQMLNNKALLLQDLGRIEQARDLLVKVRDGLVELHGREHEHAITATSSLAQVHLALKNWDKAAPLLEDVVAWRRRELGDAHPRTLIALNNLAFMYMNGPEAYDKALPLFEEVLEARTRVLGEDHRRTLISMENLGVLHKRMGNLEQSAELLEREVELAKTALGERSSDTAYAYNNLASTYTAMDRHDDAERLYRLTLDVRRELYDPGHPSLLLSMRNHAAALVRLQRYAEAEQLLLERHAMCVEHHGPDSPRTRKAIDKLIELYEQWGRGEKAAEWRAKLSKTDAS